MKSLMTVVFTVLAGPVLADPIHIIESGGHNHWLAVAALAAAAAAALWQAKNRDKQGADEEEVETDLDAEPQEA